MLPQCLDQAEGRVCPKHARLHAIYMLTMSLTEQPRRSGRATKGQHKNLDLIQEPPKRSKSSKTQSKDKSTKQQTEPPPPASEEEEIIRCICGEYEEEEDIERDMICCDKCSAWQHNDCMGLTFPKGQEPAEYFCEQCKPEDHKELLEKIARGEKPWEEAAKRRQQEIEEKKAKRRRGRKGGTKKGGGRASDVKAENSSASTPAPEGDAAPETPAPATAQADSQQPSSAQKRKLDGAQATDSVSIPDASCMWFCLTLFQGHKQKQPRTSSAGLTDQERRTSVSQSRKGSAADGGRESTSASREPASSPEEISNAARRGCANALIKLFVDQIQEAQKQQTYKLPSDKSVDDVARPLGLSLEHAMYTNLCGGSGEPNEQYKSQLRTILFNVKKNPSLRDRLLVGSLSTAALSTMSTQAMASEEQQQKDAEIKREAEKQHIIVEENRPRIRRTHKGEEIVEGDTHAGVSESIFSSTIARRAAFEAENQSPDPAVRAAGRSVSPKTQQPPEFGEAKVSQGSAANGDTGHPHSPSAVGHDAEFPEVPEHLHQQLPPESKAQADEEIDNLLKEEEEPESPPYSPKDIDSGGIVWQGKISMHPVAEFRSTARHVGGADLSGRIPWHQMIPPVLQVDGRIEIQLATNYLCGLRFSNTTDVTVISVSAPDDPSERAEFDKLFNYFTDRKRYGVVGKHPLPNVKDTYIIPIEAGVSKKPEFIELLENNSIEDPTTDRILLVVFVVKAIDFSSATPSSQQPTPLHITTQESHHPATTAAAASPLSSGTPLTQQHHPTPTTPAMQPWTPNSPATNYGVGSQFQPHQQPGFNHTYAPPPPPQQPSQQPHPPQHQQPLPPQQSPLVGIAAALHVLGPQAQAPAITELLKKVPDVNVPQLNLVRDIITRNPAAANDYTVLTQAIQQLTAGAGNGQGR